MRGSRSRIADPGRARGARAPAARPLQRLQRARRARGGAAARASALRARPRRARRGARPSFGRVETIDGRRHARLDPADQEPGRRERGPAHAAARGRARRRGPRPLDRAQRPDRRRPRRLLGLGRRLRAARRPRAGGSSAPGPARRRWRVRLKYAGVDPSAIEVEPGDRALARPGRRRGAERRALRAADLHGADRAAHAARRRAAWRRSSGDERRRLELGGRSGTTSSAAPTPPTCRSGTSSPAAPRGRCSSSARGPGAWRSTSPRAGTRSSRVDARAELIAELASARAAARARGRGGRGDARELEPRPAASPRSSPRCSSCTCSAARRSAPAAADGARAHLEPGGVFAAALLADEPPAADGEGGRRFPTCARSTAGSTRACRSRSRSTTGDRDPPAAPARLPRRRAERASSTSIRLDRLARRASSSRGRARRGCGAASGSTSPHRGPRRLDDLRPGGAR